MTVADSHQEEDVRQRRRHHRCRLRRSPFAVSAVVVVARVRRFTYFRRFPVTQCAQISSKMGDRVYAAEKLMKKRVRKVSLTSTYSYAGDTSHPRACYLALSFDNDLRALFYWFISVLDGSIAQATILQSPVSNELSVTPFVSSSRVSTVVNQFLVYLLVITCLVLRPLTTCLGMFFCKS